MVTQWATLPWPVGSARTQRHQSAERVRDEAHALATGLGAHTVDESRQSGHVAIDGVEPRIVEAVQRPLRRLAQLSRAIQTKSARFWK